MTLSPKLAAISVLTILLYLGLAIAGFGGFAAFFAQPALVALAAVTIVLTGAAMFSEGNLSAGEREDRANRWVLVAFAVLGLLSAWLPAYTDAKDIWTIDGDTVRWIGVVLFTLGGVLRLWPVFVLGRRFSGLVAIQPGHALGDRRASTVSSGTQAISACLWARSDGRSPSVPELAWCWPR